MSYDNPTPIQRHCVPLGISLSSSYDVMACAQTGSGKTVAFLVPLVTSIAWKEVSLRVERVGGVGSFMGETRLIFPLSRRFFKWVVKKYFHCSKSLKPNPPPYLPA